MKPPAHPAAELFTSLAAGAAATQIKTWAEGALQPLAEQLLPPTNAEKRRMGADAADHPDNMPPTQLLEQAGDAAGHPLSQDVRDTGSEALHWLMGVGGAVAYGLLARQLPRVRLGRGTGFGAVLFTATHGSLLAAIGVQATPSQLPRAWWIWELGSHLVYGAAVDAGLSIGDRLLTRGDGA